MIISLMVGIAKNRAIGKDNNLLWHLSDDLKNFKRVTTDKTVIMGRKTYESIGRPLPNRENVVVTRNKELSIENVIVANSLDEAIAKSTSSELVIIGGASLYKEALSRVDKMYITYVDASFEDADVFFPEFETDGWKEKQVINQEQNEKNEYSWQFVEYIK